MIQYRRSVKLTNSLFLAIIASREFPKCCNNICISIIVNYGYGFDHGNTSQKLGYIITMELAERRTQVIFTFLLLLLVYIYSFCLFNRFLTYYQKGILNGKNGLYAKNSPF